MSRGLLARGCLLFTAGALFAGGARGAREIGFAERVAAERAIARVYYAHQIDATRPFEEAVPQAVLEGSVRRSLAQSAALASYWGAPPDEDALRTEMARIARDTRFPDRLREIYAALGYDAPLVEESLARRSLADRRARERFARDPRIHREARREAETLRDRLAGGALGLRAEDPRRHVTELIRVGDDVRGEPGVAMPSEHRSTLTVGAEEFARLRSRAPERIGEIGAVAEEDDAFVIRAVLADDGVRATLLSYVVPKRTWDDWWSEAGPSFEGRAVATVASPDDTLPEPAGSMGPPTCAPGDTWDNGGLGTVPDGRTQARAVWTGSVMVAWGGYREGVYPVVGGRYDPMTDTWSRTTPFNAPMGRVGHTAVWTGSRVAIWGGQSIGGQLGNGALYDPIADAWTPIANANAPGPRQDHTAVWTGDRMVVWGGLFGDITGNQWLQTGARYDPVANAWQPTSTVNAPAGRQYHTAVWTGDSMIVWGGRISGLGQVLQTGGRYDPVGDLWTPMSTTGAPTARELHTAVWSGSEMLIWGGQDYIAGSPHVFGSGGRYDPVGDSWTPIAMAGAPPARRSHGAVWGGGVMVVWGGDAPGTYFGGGARYEPLSDSWLPISMANAPPPRTSFVSVWTGTQMLVWAGYTSGGNYPASGGRYDPLRDVWAPTYWMNPPRARHAASSIWTGSLLLVFGGLTVDEPLTTGSRYDPLLDDWSPMTTVGVVRPRVFHTAVWSGSEMLVWGGEPCPFPHDYGGRYDPIADAWQPIDYLTEPLFRRHHTAVWTGSRMLVWGGLTCESATTVTNTGAFYDPVANLWSPLTAASPPAARQEHSAVWTGSSMIVWGGQDGDTPPRFNGTGARYDDATATWFTLAKGGAPADRSHHTAIWTGSKMIVWGGTGSADFATGGIYDPVSNHWTATATGGAPTARLGHSAVWTGDTMVVWGGETSATGFDSVLTGGRFNPATNSWSPTSLFGVPAARHDHVGAWLGSFMAVWGGLGDYELDSGGRYVVTNPDGDTDGVADICDCAPANPTAFAIPDIGGLVFAADKAGLQWRSAVPDSGSGTTYDIARGRLDELPVGSGASETCLASGLAAPGASDASIPPSDGGFWYLVRGKNACGAGPYGKTSSGADEISAVCP